MADIQRVQRLVEAALDEFDDAQIMTSHILRRCLRIAKLRNDYPSLLWLELESQDVTTKGPATHLGPDILLHFDRDEAEELFTKAFRSYLARRTVEKDMFIPFSVEHSKVTSLELTKP